MCYFTFHERMLIVIFRFFENPFSAFCSPFVFLPAPIPFPSPTGKVTLLKRNKNLFEIHIPMTSGKKIFYIFTAK